jgi:hypothetical protein
MQWDEPQTELLTRLWLAGKTARAIAEKLGGGVTRNAVIGKAHRLGLTGKQGSKSAAQKRDRRSPGKISNQQPERKPRAKNRARKR